MLGNFVHGTAGSSLSQNRRARPEPAPRDHSSRILNGEDQERVRHLRLRQVHLRPDVSVEIRMLHVADDPDNRPPRRRSSRPRRARDGRLDPVRETACALSPPRSRSLAPGRRRRILGVNRRPRYSGICMTRKYSGVTE